jgi:hypothetical protein
MGNFDFTAHPGMGLVPNEGEDGPIEFMIPAGANQHRETMRWTYNGRLFGGGAGGAEGLGDLRLLGVAPHMHYAGVDMKVRLDRPVGGETACESGMLTNLFSCAAANSCLSDEDLLGCTESACGEEFAAVELPCWGCFHKVFRGGGGQAEILAGLTSCETDITPMQESEQPAQECLVSAPKYSFEWQRVYEYDAPYEALPVFTPGSVLTIECNYDNSMNNPLIRGALGRVGLDAPADVVLGDETLDEMCLIGLLFAFERRD